MIFWINTTIVIINIGITLLLLLLFFDDALFRHSSMVKTHAIILNLPWEKILLLSIFFYSIELFDVQPITLDRGLFFSSSRPFSKIVICYSSIWLSYDNLESMQSISQYNQKNELHCRKATFGHDALRSTIWTMERLSISVLY